MIITKYERTDSAKSLSVLTLLILFFCVSFGWILVLSPSQLSLSVAMHDKEVDCHAFRCDKNHRSHI